MFMAFMAVTAFTSTVMVMMLVVVMVLMAVSMVMMCMVTAMAFMGCQFDVKERIVQGMMHLVVKGGLVHIQYRAKYVEPDLL